MKEYENAKNIYSIELQAPAELKGAVALNKRRILAAQLNLCPPFAPLYLSTFNAPLHASISL
jgi:hypothetical protein